MGTSTPTSMTVVATSTASSPPAKRAMTASLSGPFMRPWTRPTRSSPKRSLQHPCPLFGSGGVRLLAFLDQRADPIGLPAAVDVTAEPIDDFGQALLADHPRLDRRPARRHFVDPADVHLAILVSVSVRGMGVAVITSKCGGRSALADSSRRCDTPKRCCSSITASQAACRRPSPGRWRAFRPERRSTRRRGPSGRCRARVPSRGR